MSELVDRLVDRFEGADDDLLGVLRPCWERAVRAERSLRAFRAIPLSGKALHDELTHYFRTQYRADCMVPPAEGSQRFRFFEMCKARGRVPSRSTLSRMISSDPVSLKSEPVQNHTEEK